jgi:DNA-binding XRE family transcriptional regulator
MGINKKIKSRREELGLDADDVADKIGLSSAEYYDIEAYANEIFMVTELRELKKLCSILKLNLYELIQLSPSFPMKSEDEVRDINFSIPRNELILKRREKLGLTQEELGDILGFYEVAIVDMEQKEDFLESWTIYEIINLSKALKIPLDALVAYKSV